MNVVGRKLTNSINTVGRKLQNTERVGRKLSGDALGASRRIGTAVDVAGRKVANTANRVNDGIAAVSPYLNGVPFAEQAATLARDASKAVAVGAQGARKLGQMVEKESRLGEATLKEASPFI